MNWFHKESVTFTLGQLELPYTTLDNLLHMSHNKINNSIDQELLVIWHQRPLFK